MKAITLSGWGQPHDSLAVLAPDATHIDYARHDNLADALATIARAGEDAHTVIGWSLGGQMAVRAIANGLLKPKLLVLIAVPFQFVATQELVLGMKRDLYDKFHDNYARNPSRTLAKGWELIVKDDKHAHHVRAAMEGHDAEDVQARQWLHWLKILDGFSCADLHLANFPRTKLVHGDMDAVVDVEQMEYFARAIPHAQTLRWEECGHAPHWHDPQALREWIAG